MTASFHPTALDRDVFRYLIRRLLWAGVLFIAVTIVTYVIFYIIPADPAKLFAGKAARPEDVARVAHNLGLDRPFYVQYWKFLQQLVFHGSLGTSFATRQDVNTIVFNAAPVTASLVFGGAILWMMIAVPVGVPVRAPPALSDGPSAMVFVLVGISAHPVWLGLIFSYFFGYKLGLDADHRLLQRDQPAVRGVRRAGCNGPTT